ncbi:MAG: hypothetical protein IIA00_00775 [Proteobacteria bacterium]|nr:hypothetical protein [Pseudomonadota bacterium]
MPNYKSPMPLSDDHMRLIGIIAAHWEAIDIMLQQALAEIMEFEFHRVALLTRHISFGDKINLLMIYARRAFQDEGHKKLWRKFTDANQGLRDANDLRNKYVHSGWPSEDSGDSPIRAALITKGGKLTLVYDPTPITELENAAEQIYQAGQTYLEFLQQFGLLQPSLPRSL